MMNITFTSPWQMLLWIVALLLACAPVVAFTVNWIFGCYFRQKANYFTRMANGFGKALETVTKQMEANKKSE